MKYGIIFLIFLVLPLSSSLSFAREVKKYGKVTGLVIPRFVTLKGRESNLRVGPGSEYPIKFTYRCRGYPVQITAEFENWRRVCDYEGNEGWVHESLLSGIRNVLLRSNKTFTILPYQLPRGEIVLFRLPGEMSSPLFRAEIGSIARLNSCIGQWCEVVIGKHKGWIQQKNLWGIDE